MPIRMLLTISLSFMVISSRAMSSPGLLPLLHLLLGIVGSLAHALKVRWISEEFRIATVRADMVNHWTVRCWCLYNAEHTGLLACVSIPRRI